MKSLGFESFEQNAVIDAAEVAVTGLVVYLEYHRRLWKRRYQAAVQENRLDPKTGALTYPAFREAAIKRTALTHRSSDIGKVHGLILSDIDEFKELNSRLTHPVADERALLPVAEAHKGSVRPETDFVGRFGGEEFVTFLNDVDPASMLAVCQRLQSQINAIKPDGGSTDSIGLTIAYTTLPQGGDYDEAFQRLSAAMLEAKNIEGKNQIVEVPA